MSAAIGVGKISRLAAKEEPCRGAHAAAQPQILYLARREGLSSVFPSQVLSRMAAVAEAGLAVDIGVFTPVGQWVRPALRGRWARIVASAPGVLYDRIYRLPSFPSRVDLPTVEALFLAFWLRARYGHSLSPIILQCRNATVTGMALKIRNMLRRALVVFDCRGLEDHEFLYVRGQTFETAARGLRVTARRLAAEQMVAVRNADAVVCVSSSMVDYLTSEYGISQEKCVVVPCCVDTKRSDVAVAERKEMRRRLGFEGRLVVVYCGSLSRWQLPHESLRLFRRIQSWYPDAHFLGITPEHERMRAEATRAGVPPAAMTVVAVPHEKVAAYLAASDVALLFRDSNVVNTVASPVKFAEYLASGTPVVVSDGVGDYSNLVCRERVGVVLPSSAPEARSAALLQAFLDEYRVAPDDWRARCRHVALGQLDFAVHVPKLIQMYDRLSQREQSP